MIKLNKLAVNIHNQCVLVNGLFCQLDKIGYNCILRASSINAPNNMDNFCPDKRLNFLNSKKLLMDLAYS